MRSPGFSQRHLRRHNLVPIGGNQKLRAEALAKERADNKKAKEAEEKAEQKKALANKVAAEKMLYNLDPMRIWEFHKRMRKERTNAS